MIVHTGPAFSTLTVIACSVHNDRTQCSAGISTATDRRCRASSRRPARGSEIVGGRYFRSRGGASAIGPHRPHTHVRGFGAAPHGTFHRGPGRGADRKQKK